MLKQKLLFAATSLLALLLVSTSAQAQYDDMYYDPDEFRSVEPAPDYYQEDYAERSDAPRDNAFRSSSSYADDYYDYAYSSRIRRFNRPYAGFGYYDPVYVDMAYYDPFFQPFGTTSLIYNSGFGYNRFNRFGRSAFLEPVVTPYGVAYVDRGFGGWNRGFGWNDPFYGNAWGAGGFGRGYYGGGLGYGGFGGGAFVTPGGYYCPPAWGGGNTYVVNNNVSDAPARRTVTSVPRAATTSIADRVARTRQNTTVTPRSLDRGTTATRSSNGRTLRTADRSSNGRIDRSRTTVTPRSNTRSATPSRSYTPSRSATRTRTYTPSRSTTPTRSSATPSRSSSPRSYSPSRSTSPTRSYSPSRSSSTRSYSPSSSSRSSGSGSTRSTTTTRSTTRGGGRGGR